MLKYVKWKKNNTHTHIHRQTSRNRFYLCKFLVGFDLLAVQNERQPRNTATIRPEAFRDMDQSRALREAAVAVGVFA